MQGMLIDIAAILLALVVWEMFLKGFFIKAPKT